MTIETVIFRLLLVTLLCGSIGFERGYRGRAAGLRTHILVGIGSAITVMTGVYAVNVLGFSDADPLRIAAQVISGMGFLGVGTILVRGKSMVTGLTTAAGLWATATISIAVGIGFYSAAVTGTFIALFSFAFLTKFERSGHGSKSAMKLYIECSDIDKLNDLMTELRDPMYRLGEFEITPSRSGMSKHIGIEATMLLTGKMKKKDERYEYLKPISELESVVCTIESV